MTFWSQGVHPALISRELYERCQLVRQLFGNQPRSGVVRIRHNYPLSGYLYCAQCGQRMVGFFRHGERRYSCTTPLGHAGSCQQTSVNAEIIENQVAKFFSRIPWTKEWKEEYRVKVKRGKPLMANDEMNLRELEQVENFAVNWRRAKTLVEQKKLLQFATVRLTLHDQELIEVQMSPNLSRLLLRLGWVRKKGGSNPGYRLCNSESQVRIKLSSRKPGIKEQS